MAEQGPDSTADTVQGGRTADAPVKAPRGLWGSIVAFGKAIWYGKEGAPEESILSTGNEPPELDYSRADRWFKTFTRWLSYVAGAALGVITLVCFVDVIGWKFFNWTIPSASDLVTQLNLVVVFLAAAFVQMDRGSVSIELLQNKFTRVVKLATRIFASVLGAAICFFAAYRGWTNMADFLDENAMVDGVWRFKVWPYAAVLVLGFVCLAIAFLFTIARDVTNYRQRRAVFAPKPAKIEKGAPPSATEETTTHEGEA